MTFNLKPREVLLALALSHHRDLLFAICNKTSPDLGVEKDGLDENCQSEMQGLVNKCLSLL